MLEPFQLPFVQRGLLEILILAVPAGLLGTWIVLRRLAFYSHALGTAAFPGLVLADGLGFAAPLGAFAAAAAFSAGNSALGRRRREDADAVVAIVLAACLAAGVILASDVFDSGSNIETLLFGSLLLIDNGDIALALAAAVATLLATGLVGGRWLALGFDPDAAAAGREAAVLDALLLGLIALATTAALTVIGALLVAAIFVVPAATARLLTSRLSSCQLVSIGLVAAEGTLGLWLSVKANASPGATIACVSGAVFALVAGIRAIGPLPRPAIPAALLAAAAVAVAVASGCGAQLGTGANGLAVVATTTQIGDWVREVGGPRVSVHQVLRPNTDPHEYEPRPDDVAAAAGARLVFANGDGLDGWIGQVVFDSGGDAEVVDLGAAVPLRLPGESDSERYDPHWWLDPRDAAAAVREIERRLAAADPVHRGRYERNADAYLERVGAVDRRLARCFASIPAARRRLVTDHDAFGYFADRYGIEVAGAAIPSQATEAQPSARDLRDLARAIEAEGVGAIFPESSLSPKVADAIARQTGARFGEALYGDTLGPSGSSGATYLGMERADADAMARGFTGGRRGCG